MMWERSSRKLQETKTPTKYARNIKDLQLIFQIKLSDFPNYPPTQDLYVSFVG